MFNVFVYFKNVARAHYWGMGCILDCIGLQGLFWTHLSDTSKEYSKFNFCTSSGILGGGGGA